MVVKMDLCKSLGMLLKAIFHHQKTTTDAIFHHQKTNTEKQVSSQLEEVRSSSKFIWKIENLSKLSPKGHCSDVFTIGGFTWKAVLFQEVYGNYSAMLELVDGRPSTDLLVEFSLAITSQTDKNHRITKECTGQILHLAELCNPDKGYVVNDTCILEILVFLDGGSNLECEPKDSKRSGESLEHPCAGQPFEKIDNHGWSDPQWEDEDYASEDDSDDCNSREDNEDSEKVGSIYDYDDDFTNIGGFDVNKKHASLYRKIWMKYGHIGTTKVIPQSSYFHLVMLVGSVVQCVLDMDRCGFLDISSDRIELWEENIKMAEKLEFNISWLRGFNVIKIHASLYRKIWMKYGHIGTTKVLPVSSYPRLVMLVGSVVQCVMNMDRCRFLEISSERIELWEENIKMAEKLKFNISWLRERFESVKNTFESMKKSFGGMQKFKSELLQHGQILYSAKSRMKAVEHKLKKAEVQLITAKDYVRQNISGLLLSESDMDMYLFDEISKLCSAKSKKESAKNELKKAQAQLIIAEDSVRENMSGLLSETDMQMYLEFGENPLLDGMF